MGRDKKALDGLTFVLDGPDGVEVVAGVFAAPVLEALDRMAPVNAATTAAHRAARAAALARRRRAAFHALNSRPVVMAHDRSGR